MRRHITLGWYILGPEDHPLRRQREAAIFIVVLGSLLSIFGTAALFDLITLGQKAYWSAPAAFGFCTAGLFLSGAGWIMRQVGETKFVRICLLFLFVLPSAAINGSGVMQYVRSVAA